MSILARIKRRLRGELAPLPPFTCRDSVSTRLFSLDDEPHTPSPRLLGLAGDVIREASRVDLSALNSRPNMPALVGVWPGEHYRLLAALTLLLKPQVVVEIGTFTGMGTLALRQFLPEGGRIATFDIEPWNRFAHTCLLPADFTDGRITQYVDNLSDATIVNRHLGLLTEAELIFIDGPHDGLTEYQMLAQLQCIPFRRPPLLVFDDIKLPTLLKFWRDLPYPKMDMTSFGHWSGTGLAEWKPSGK